MARASLCLARGQQRGTPGARNRSQINVARQVSSRFFSPRRPYKDNIPGRAFRSFFALAFSTLVETEMPTDPFPRISIPFIPFLPLFSIPARQRYSINSRLSKSSIKRFDLQFFFFQYPVEFLALRGSISNALFPLFFFSRENLSGRGSSHTFHVSTGPDVQIRST